MPYNLVKLKGGYKVQNKETKKVYSKTPLTKTKAKKQLIALKIRTGH